jgi:hypothetical protein
MGEEKDFSGERSSEEKFKKGRDAVSERRERRAFFSKKKVSCAALVSDFYNYCICFFSFFILFSYSCSNRYLVFS